MGKDAITKQMANERLQNFSSTSLRENLTPAQVRYNSQKRQAGEYITVDPAERFKTEF
jgi:hypothetical protein